MPLELRLTAAFAVAAAITWALTPLAMRVAHATGFLDHPAGYKGHRAPTPYLGGSAIIAGVVLAGLAFGGGTDDYAVVIACAAALWVVGTTDDRVNLSPYLRLLIEAGVATVLWVTGHGWEWLSADALDLLLTCVWVIAVVNAVNLMDNMDGAASSVVAISALGTGVLAALEDLAPLAGLCFAIAGACAGFIPRNLARPARIFMGDGGSMPLGMLLACVAPAAAAHAATGRDSLAAATLLVGLAIFDTALVMISRRRGGRPLMTGGRDHLTHRLRARLGSARPVVAVLVVAQVLLCAASVALARTAPGAEVEFGLVMAVLGAWAIWRLDDPAWLEHRVGVAPSLDALHSPEPATAPARQT